MNKTLTLSLLIGFLSTVVSVKISVHTLGLNPKEPLIQNIDFSIANFGYLPFGKTMIGKLILSPNFSDQCNFIQHPDINSDQNYFMIVPRGNCQFVPKALNAQKAGAKLVIFVDTQTTSGPLIVMTDNGQGYKVKIPSVLIKHQDGQNLIKTVNQAKQHGQQLIVKVQLDNHKTDKVQVELYLESNNRQSYKFIKQFQQFYDKISTFIDLKLIYHVDFCPLCLQADCYYGQEYCSSQYKKGNKASGRDILDQQIIQMIIWEKAPQKWWEWMSYIDDQCIRISQLKQCSRKGMSKMGIDADSVEKAFAQSFNSLGDNNYLQRSSKSLKQAGVPKYPGVVINGLNVRGTIQAEYIFEDICNSFLNPPEVCNSQLDPPEIGAKKDSHIRVNNVIIDINIKIDLLAGDRQKK